MQPPSKGCIERLTREYKKLTKEPVPYCCAKPAPSNILEWHFVITGAPSTDFEGGTYHGKLQFAPDYPFKPPGILFLTPSGRFTPNAKICFSFSDFHPDTWNPMWHVGTILNGVLSFMNEESTTTGSMCATSAARKAMALESMSINMKNPAFRSMFPELVEAFKAKQKLQLPDEGAEHSNPKTAKGGVPALADESNGQSDPQSSSTEDTAAGKREPAANSLLSILPIIVVGTIAVAIVLLPMFSAK